MDDASAYCINLKNTGALKNKLSRSTQIIALTTQLSKLKPEISKLSTHKDPLKQNEIAPTPESGPRYVLSYGALRKLIASWNTT
jgi:hypothetical protein